jgi:hypothetical protein
LRYPDRVRVQPDGRCHVHDCSRIAENRAPMNRQMLNLAPEFAVNVLGPWAVFELMDKSCGDTNAVIASALPPLAWSMIGLSGNKKVAAFLKKKRRKKLLFSWACDGETSTAQCQKVFLLLFVHKKKPSSSLRHDLS